MRLNTSSHLRVLSLSGVLGGILPMSPCRGSGLYFNLENALKVNALFFALFMYMPFLTLAQHNHAGQTPYAGMQNRAIKALSDSDINELRRGGGWGLALAAELNGMPGPSHLLELKDNKIPLAADQVDKTQVLLDEMRKAAIPTGERLIAAEKALEAAFASGNVDEISLSLQSKMAPLSSSMSPRPVSHPKAA